MKKVQEAVDVSAFRLTECDFVAIHDDVTRALERARQNIRNAQESQLRGGACRPERSEDARASALPPSTNRGGNYGEKPEFIAARLVLNDGKILEIPARRTWGGSSAFLDWVNFTTDESDYFELSVPISDEELMVCVSAKMETIFGFGITQKREQGANFYHRSYVLGDGYGMVCHGGQKDTVLVMLSGEGCDAAKEGWHERLYEFLNACKSGRTKLTRVDLAHDDYAGERYSVEAADKDFDAGLFKSTKGGRTPNHEYRGNWKRPNGKGRTLYIGNRKNGKFARIYEKGKQLGDANSNWVRVEVEFKAIDRELPFDILLNPGQYLAASYPAFGWISTVQERILTVQKKLEISYQAMTGFVKTQFGKALWVMRQMEGSAEAVLQKVMRQGFPDRLKLPMWQEADSGIHHDKKIQMNRQFFDHMALA